MVSDFIFSLFRNLGGGLEEEDGEGEEEGRKSGEGKFLWFQILFFSVSKFQRKGGGGRGGREEEGEEEEEEWRRRKGGGRGGGREEEEAPAAGLLKK